MKRRYSGHRSTKFWKRINAISSPDGERLYARACDLQDLEHELLTYLKVLENKKKSPKYPNS